MCFHSIHYTQIHTHCLLMMMCVLSRSHDESSVRNTRSSRAPEGAPQPGQPGQSPARLGQGDGFVVVAARKWASETTTTTVCHGPAGPAHWLCNRAATRVTPRRSWPSARRRRAHRKLLVATRPILGIELVEVGNGVPLGGGKVVPTARRFRRHCEHDQPTKRGKRAIVAL